ncbi:MAG: hypothetical protein U0869_10495 [Chloroflexota bacterium]
MRVPGFLARQFIVAGSLRNEPAGFSVMAKNPIGDGWLIAIGHIRIDGVDVQPARITATRAGDPRVLLATDVSRETPVAFRKGDEVTFHVAGLHLDPGEHDLEVELTERDMGVLTVGIRERSAA